MPEPTDYVPPRVWTWNKDKPTPFPNNRPTAGPIFERALPTGRRAFQLYSAATPNGIKVCTLFEELLATGREDAEYDLWTIDILEKGEQFSSGFVELNPNAKIPALLDRSGPEPIRVFESGAILLHLANKFGAFIPDDPRKRAECLSWLFWQVSSIPYVGGGFGHFYVFAPTKIEYAIDRYALETKRQLDVLDRRLAESEYLAGDQYSIADMAVAGWYGGLMKGMIYGAAEFLSVDQYKHLMRWTDQMLARPAVMRALMTAQTPERHSAADLKV
ncbi:MAG: glutathione-dependent disulfide-bond oxidoreductase [Caulobacteraceae bacterium]|nr:glutathione-dependent disulfide-bond oxidoreductase [Caulobacteraceae bacterium]